MTIQRMKHAGIVVDDLEAATAFFVELGLKLQGAVVNPVRSSSFRSDTHRRPHPASIQPRDTARDGTKKT